MHPEIREFQGQYRWLSNFWPATVELGGVMYPTVEHAYQASKTIIPKERMWVYGCKTPGDAKRMGRELTLREDWLRIRLTIMEDLVNKKFTRYPDLMSKLAATYHCVITEGNYWHDNFWGECYCEKCTHRVKYNQLGGILMGIRNTYWETGQGE